MKVAVLGLRGIPDVPGGIETHAQHLYPRLVDRGCKVVLFTRRPYVDAELTHWKGVQLRSLACPRQKFLEAIWHSFRAVLAARAEDPDIVHVHAIGPSLVVPFARFLGMRVVMTHHGPDYERKKWGWAPKQVLRLGEWCAKRWAHQIICVAPHIADAIRLSSRSEPVVIPNGVDIPQNETGEEALDRFGLTKGRYMLAVGRFVPEKGFHHLVEAFARLSADARIRGAGWKLALVGSADHEDAYSRRLVAAAEATPGVILTGYQTGRALAQLLSHAGMFVLPSTYEGLPIALLEAMSYGLSCLATDISANRAAGLALERLFSPDDAAALAQSLEKFLSSPMTRNESQAQVEHIRERFNWDAIADRTLAVYRLMMRQSIRSPRQYVSG